MICQRSMAVHEKRCWGAPDTTVKEANDLHACAIYLRCCSWYGFIGVMLLAGCGHAYEVNETRIVRRGSLAGLGRKTCSVRASQGEGLQSSGGRAEQGLVSSHEVQDR